MIRSAVLFTFCLFLFAAGCNRKPAPPLPLNTIEDVRAALIKSGWPDAEYHPIQTSTGFIGILDAGLMSYGNLKFEIYRADTPENSRKIVSIFQEKGFSIAVREPFIVVMSDDENPDAVSGQLAKIGFAQLPKK